MININIVLPQTTNIFADTDNPINYMLEYTSVVGEIAKTQPSRMHPTLDMCETSRKIIRSRGTYSISVSPLPKTVNPDKLTSLKTKDYHHQGTPRQACYFYSRGSINNFKAAALKFISFKSKVTSRSASRRRVHSPAYGARCRQCSCGQSGGASWMVRQLAALTGWPSHEAQPLPFAATSPQGNPLGDELDKPSVVRSLADTRLSTIRVLPGGAWAPQGNLLESGTPFGGRINHEGRSQGNSFNRVVLGRSGLCKGWNECKGTRKRQVERRSRYPPSSWKSVRMSQIRQNRCEKIRGFRKTYHRLEWPPPDLTESLANQLSDVKPHKDRYAETVSSPDLATICEGGESKEQCQPADNGLIYQSKSTPGSLTKRKSKNTQYLDTAPVFSDTFFLRLIPCVRLTG
jgi:hypothetical protein